jgi:hypothetical protein
MVKDFWPLQEAYGWTCRHTTFGKNNLTGAPKKMSCLELRINKSTVQPLAEVELPYVVLPGNKVTRYRHWVP